jgi:hypothetical protein
MTKDEALKLALEALETELAVDITNGAEVGEAAELMCEAIAAINQALAAPVQEPHKGLSEHLAQATNGRVYVDPVTGDVGIGTPAAPDLQAELDATNRQVEILSDALAESRREVDAMIALARADERERIKEENQRCYAVKGNT